MLSLCSNGRSASHVTPLGCEGVYEYVKDKIYESVCEREICYFMWMCVWACELETKTSTTSCQAY